MNKKTNTDILNKIKCLKDCKCILCKKEGKCIIDKDHEGMCVPHQHGLDTSHEY